jgi:hypothetical protein
LKEDAIAIVLHVPLTVVERVAIGFSTAKLPDLIVQMFKPRVQRITRPLTGWIADEDNGSSE